MMTPSSIINVLANKKTREIQCFNFTRKKISICVRLRKCFCLLSRMSMEVEGSLVIAQVAEDDDAKYQCLAKNVVGTRGSEKAQLSVLGKIFFFLY